MARRREGFLKAVENGEMDDGDNAEVDALVDMLVGNHTVLHARKIRHIKGKIIVDIKIKNAYFWCIMDCCLPMAENGIFHVNHFNF